MSITFIRISKAPKIQLREFVAQNIRKDGELPDEERKFLQNFEIKSTKMLEQEQYLDLIKLTFTIREKYPNQNKLNQFIIGLTVYVINQISDKKLQTEVVELFLSDLATRNTLDFNTKLKTLSYLFNSLPKTNPIQMIIFLNLVDLTAANSKIHLLYTSITNIDDLISEWNVTPADKRKVYNSIISKLGQSSAINKIRTDLIIKYINSFEKAQADTKEIAELNQIVVCLLNFGYAVFEHRNVLNSKGAAIIEKNNQHLFEAFKCYVQGDLDSYFAYEEQNKNFVEGVGIKKAEYQKKVRVFYISQFTEPGTSIKYNDFAQILKIKEEQVEYWVILAINSGIIDAKLDQYNQTIFLKNNQCKYFDLEQWQKLDGNLQKLIKQLDSYLGNPN